jgi:hypothetical protein
LKLKLATSGASYVVMGGIRTSTMRTTTLDAVFLQSLRRFFFKKGDLATHLESSVEGMSRDNDAKWRGSDSW